MPHTCFVPGPWAAQVPDECMCSAVQESDAELSEDVHPVHCPCAVCLCSGIACSLAATPSPPSMWELLAPDFGDYTLLSRSINTSEVGSVM